MKNVFKTVLVITLFTILTRLLGFIFRIYLSRTIGAECLGIFQIAFSVFVVLITICCSGIPITISRLTAKFDITNKQKKFSAVTSGLILSLSLACVLCLSIILFKELFSNLFTDYACLLVLISMLPALIFSAVYGTIRGYLWGVKDFFTVCIIELIEQIMRITSCVIILLFSFSTLEKTLSLGVSLSFSIFISCIISLIVYKKKKGKFLKPNDTIKETLTSSTPITLMRIVSSVIMPIISILLPFGLVNAGYTNEQALTLFGIAMGMAYPLLFLPTTLIDSLAVTLVTNLSILSTQKKHFEVRNSVSTSFEFACFVSCLCFPVFCALGEPICIFFFDNAIAGEFLCKASLLLIPLSLNGITTTMLNSLEKEKQTFLYFIFSGFLLIASILITPKYLGIDSIIFSLLLQEITIFVLNVRLLIKNSFLNTSTLKKLFKLFSLSCFVALLAYNSYIILSFTFILPISLILSCAFAFILFSLLTQLTNLYNLKVMFLQFNFKKKLHKKNL